METRRARDLRGPSPATPGSVQHVHPGPQTEGHSSPATSITPASNPISLAPYLRIAQPVSLIITTGSALDLVSNLLTRAVPTASELVPTRHQFF